MNKDEIEGLMVRLLLMGLSPLAVQLHLDQNTTSAIATDIADLVVLGYSVYRHWNMKKVPETATVIPNPPHETH